MNDKDQYVLEKLKRQLELTTDVEEIAELEERIAELEWSQPKVKKEPKEPKEKKAKK